MGCMLGQAYLLHKGGQVLHEDSQKDSKIAVVVGPSSSSVVVDT